jgi:hypothetical protein
MSIRGSALLVALTLLAPAASAGDLASARFVLRGGAVVGGGAVGLASGAPGASVGGGGAAIGQSSPVGVSTGASGVALHAGVWPAFARGAASLPADADGDGLLDGGDNCTAVPNPDQRDTDADGYGNLCDADFDQNGFVNLVDLQLFKGAFFTADPDADFDGSGLVNLVDLARMRALFLRPPGPSAFAPAP